MRLRIVTASPWAAIVLSYPAKLSSNFKTLLLKSTRSSHIEPISLSLVAMLLLALLRNSVRLDSRRQTSQLSAPATVVRVAPVSFSLLETRSVRTWMTGLSGISKVSN